MQGRTKAEAKIAILEERLAAAGIHDTPDQNGQTRNVSQPVTALSSATRNADTPEQKQSPIQPKDWPDLLARHYINVEKWATTNMVMPLDVTATHGKNGHAIVRMSREVVGHDPTAKRYLDDPVLRPLVFTSAINQYIIATIWEKTSNLYEDIQAECAQKYERQLKEYVNNFRSRPAPDERSQRISELARLGAQVTQVKDFFTKWVRAKTTAITEKLFDLVSCLIPETMIEAAHAAMRRLIEQAVRMAVRMRTEESDWEFRHFRYSDDFEPHQTVIRDDELPDPFSSDTPRRMVELCMSPSVMSKKYIGQGLKMTAQRLHKAEIRTAPKVQKKPNREGMRAIEGPSYTR